MNIAAIVLGLVACLSQTCALSYTIGSAPGIAMGTTGGGSVKPVTPTTIAQLKSYLQSSASQVIILNQAFNFAGTEGTKTEPGCRCASASPRTTASKARTVS